VAGRNKDGFQTQGCCPRVKIRFIAMGVDDIDLLLLNKATDFFQGFQVELPPGQKSRSLDPLSQAFFQNFQMGIPGVLESAHDRINTRIFAQFLCELDDDVLRPEKTRATDQLEHIHFALTFRQYDFPFCPSFFCESRNGPAENLLIGFGPKMKAIWMGKFFLQSSVSIGYLQGFSQF
jgi:hypothetical protein